MEGMGDKTKETEDFGKLGKVLSRLGGEKILVLRKGTGSRDFMILGRDGPWDSKSVPKRDAKKLFRFLYESLPSVTLDELSKILVLPEEEQSKIFGWRKKDG